MKILVLGQDCERNPRLICPRCCECNDVCTVCWPVACQCIVQCHIESIKHGFFLQSSEPELSPQELVESMPNGIAFRQETRWHHS